MLNEHDTHETHGANAATYNLIFVVLFVITIVELIAAQVSGAVGSTLILAFSTLKAGIVVAYYMHLKYDPPIFTWIFVVPMLMGAAIIISLQGLAGY
jgi:cytochrome c oxidase subunit IV